MYLNHSCNIMPDSYCENISFSLTDSDSNACKKAYTLYQHKSCIETRVFVQLFPNV